MFEYIIGKLVDEKEDYIVLENGGIGYKIYTPKNSLSNLDLSRDNTKIYTYFNVREDGVFLYGFSSYDELNMFKLLLLVSKIGPKIALGILSALSINDIKLAILNNRSDILCEAPGIGKKTASRIILELKDRIDQNIDVDNKFDIVEDNNIDEAINGLISLGYTRKETDNILSKIDLDGLKTEDIIKTALKKLSKK